MTATDTSSRPTTPLGPGRPQRLGDVIASEWTKIWTVRSSWWTLLLALVLTIGFSVLLTWGVSSTFNEGDAPLGASEAVSLSLTGMMFGELILAVFGVLFITSEYSTGGIHTTLSSVPRRWRMVVAKVAVVTAVTFVGGLIIVFPAFFAGQAILGSLDMSVGLGDPGVLRAVVGSALYLVAAALFGLGVGLVVRNSGGGITAAIAGLLVLPSLAGLLPGEWGATAGKFITSNAGRLITLVEPTPNSLGPWVGYGVFMAWAVGLLVIGTVLLQRRDA